MLRNKLFLVLALTNPLAWAVLATLGAITLVVMALFSVVIAGILAYAYWREWESGARGVVGDSWDHGRWSGATNGAKETVRESKIGCGDNVCVSILMADAASQGLAASGLTPPRGQNHTPLAVSPLVPTKPRKRGQGGKRGQKGVENRALVAVSAQSVTRKPRKRKVKGQIEE